MINKRGLFILSICAAAAVALAIGASSMRRDSTAMSQGEGEPLFPKLVDSINDVARVTIARPAESFTLRLDGDVWRLEQMGGYPAKFEKVRQTLIGLGDMTLVEKKTARPDSYSRLKVEDIDAPGAASTQVSMYDAKGNVIGEAIIGQRVASMSRGAKGSVFVRRVGEEQSWRAEGDTYIDVSMLNWIERELVKIARQRVASATITHPDGEVVRVSKDSPADSAFAIEEIPEGMSPNSPAVGDTIGTALSYLGLEDARLDGAIELPEAPAAVATFRTFDGLVVAVDVFEIDGETWATISASADDELLAARGEGGDEAAPDPVEEFLAPDEVRDEITRINETADGWVFKIQSYKGETFRRRMSDLVNETKMGDAEMSSDAAGMVGDGTFTMGSPAPSGGDSDATDYSSLIQALAAESESAADESATQDAAATGVLEEATEDEADAPAADGADEAPVSEEAESGADANDAAAAAKTSDDETETESSADEAPAATNQEPATDPEPAADAPAETEKTGSE